MSNDHLFAHSRVEQLWSKEKKAVIQANNMGGSRIDLVGCSIKNEDQLGTF